MKIKTTIHLTRNCKYVLKQAARLRGMTMSYLVESLIMPALDLFPLIDDNCTKKCHDSYYPSIDEPRRLEMMPRILPITDKDDILNYLDGVEESKQLPPIDKSKPGHYTADRPVNCYRFDIPCRGIICSSYKHCQYLSIKTL